MKTANSNHTNGKSSDSSSKKLRLKTELQKGINDIAAGRVKDGRAVKADLRKRIG